MRDDQGWVSQRRSGRGAKAVATVILVSLGGAAWAALASSQHNVSQKNQAFDPGELAIKRGETVRIVNDDGELLHHAYLEFEDVQLRFRRPGAGRQGGRHFSRAGHLQRPVRHSPQDEAARPSGLTTRDGLVRCRMRLVARVPAKDAGFRGCTAR